jgi:hypothetical protein
MPKMIITFDAIRFTFDVPVVPTSRKKTGKLAKQNLAKLAVVLEPHGITAEGDFGAKFSVEFLGVPRNKLGGTYGFE